MSKWCCNMCIMWMLHPSGKVADSCCSLHMMALNSFWTTCCWFQQFLRSEMKLYCTSLKLNMLITLYSWKRLSLKFDDINIILYIYIPVVPARGGAEVALGIYTRRPFSSIELACAVRQPGPCVRAFCESGVLFHMSHLKLHFALHTSHCTLHTPYFTLHTSHFTLHFTLHTSRHTALLRLHTSHFTLHTSHFTVHASHFSLLTAFFTLHTSLFTLHFSRPTLHTALFTLHTSSHLSSSHLIPAHLFSSHLFSYVIWTVMNHFPVLLRELACAVRQPGPCVRALCEAVAVLFSKNMTCARPRCNATPSEHFLHTSHCTLHTQRFTLHTCTSSQLISSELFSSHSMSSHMSAKFFLAIFMSSERSSTFLISPKLVSTHLGSSARQKAWDTDAFTRESLCKILCTTKLAQSTCQYYFVLHSLHRVLPSSTLHTRLEETPFVHLISPLRSSSQYFCMPKKR